MLSYMHSNFHKEELIQKWTLNNAETVLVKARKAISSPPFSMLQMTKKFSLSVSGSFSFFGKGGLEGLNLSIGEVYHKGSHKDNVWILDCSFLVLNPENEVLASCSVPADTVFIENGVTVPIRCHFSCIELKDYLFNDSLIIQTKGTFMLLNNPIESVWKCTIFRGPRVSKHWKIMFDEELFTDLEVNAGGKMFKVHRGVLASSSSVFLEILKTREDENEEGPLDIPDIDHRIMADLLAYIYCGSAPHIKELAKELLLAANKYDLPDLAKLCESELVSNLTPSNASEILLLAYSPELPSKYSKTLMKACLYFIKHNTVLVFKSESWETLKDSSPKLAMEVAEAIAQ